jgi:hypothetical protein
VKLSLDEKRTLVGALSVAIAEAERYHSAVWRYKSLRKKLEKSIRDGEPGAREDGPRP